MPMYEVGFKDRTSLVIHALTKEQAKIVAQASKIQEGNDYSVRYIVLVK